MKVKATRQGFYGGRLRIVGDVFEISDDVHPPKIQKREKDGQFVTNEETGEPVMIRHPKAGKCKAFSERWMVEVKDEPVKQPDKVDAKQTLSGIQKGTRSEPVI